MAEYTEKIIHMPQYKTEDDRAKDVSKNREVAAFSYTLILSPVLLFTRRDSPFIQFHAKQATILFIAAVVFAQFDRPWSWMNFFVLAIALTGFIQANFGATWRAPLIANIIETGVSSDGIWNKITHYFNVLKHVFIHKKDSRKKKEELPNIPANAADNLSEVLAQQNEVLGFQRERIGFLEKELLTASILRKNRVEDMKEAQKESIKNITARLGSNLGKRAKIDMNSYIMKISLGEKEILFGGFEKEGNSAWAYTNFEIKNAETFGQFFGINVPLGDEKEWGKVVGTIKN